jgi:hypothetical protein
MKRIGLTALAGIGWVLFAMSLIQTAPAGEPEGGVAGVCPGDADGNGVVDIDDIVLVVLNFGPCPDLCTNVTCAIPNATSVCNPATGLCEIVACDSGFADCNGNPLDGCEVNILTDPQHCGACGNVCTPGDNCVAGTCVGP